MTIIRFFASPALSSSKTEALLAKLKVLNEDVTQLSTELCYHVELGNNVDYLNINQIKVLSWILSSPVNPHSLKNESVFRNIHSNQGVIEVGPRFNFSTADSSNSVQICQSVGLYDVVRLEVSRRHLITLEAGKSFTSTIQQTLSGPLYDRMTQCLYTKENLPRLSFEEGLPKNLEPWFTVPLMKEGKKAMEDVNTKLGLAFDSWDIDFYTDLFLNKLKRDPTSVECFDLAQSNSEHSRHWFFKGKIILDGQEYKECLIDLIAGTQRTSNDNNVIKFGDNSSAIKGFTHDKLRPSDVTAPSQILLEQTHSDIIFTAETHNMPTGVAPFSGATTGTGGRIRDVQGVGRGGHTVAGTAGYSVGNLHIPGYDLPWENKTWSYPNNFASPLDIIIEASNGASDYGNKFGEPVVTGFVMSYGLKNGDSEREEFVKPIMFSGGIGYMPHDMIKKNSPAKEMLVVKIGGPVYRIGVGGGAASSVAVQGGGDRDHALDFGAVQRGDAEMGNRLNRAVRGCLEAKSNPIQSIHDQGAGGNGNVLKEIVEPEGAVIYTREFQLGDPTITTLELWGAEYQENDALLCTKEDRKLVEGICNRERCPVSFVGEVTGDGYVSLIEDAYDQNKLGSREDRSKLKLPFDLHLDAVLGNMPQKTFDLRDEKKTLTPLVLPGDITVSGALERVLRLVSVGSKRYLTNKVDRCVTGLVGQQQCVGPLHTPLADYAVMALSYWGLRGAATSIGTQCIKGLLDPAAGARMTLGEALTNLVFAGISELRDVKCSGNWMWAGKTGREGARLVKACRGMCDAMATLGVAVDGGKDSLSMAARVGNDTVRSPGTLVISTYAPCPDITVKVDPALKQEGAALLWVPLTPGKYRLGGSALAQCYEQQGDDVPDADNLELLRDAFNATQALLKARKLLSGHDISDGGLITALLEMAFGGLRGINVNIDVPSAVTVTQALFNEELGLLIEVEKKNMDYVLQYYKKHNVLVHDIGSTGAYGMESQVVVKVNDVAVLESQLLPLLRLWEETSYRLELLQANSECIEEEWKGLSKRTGPTYNVTFDPAIELASKSNPVRVAVLREEGTNGDREMIASLMKAQFEVFDVTMNDLLQNAITLDRFQGLVFPGGFSYADTLGSAKGWAAGILFSERVRKQFEQFRARPDTFSLGVCNGCQLMALLGWINPLPKQKHSCELTPQVFLDHNKSERFECRWSTVKITEKPSSESYQNVWMSGMGGSVLGVWVAHGEGRFSASLAVQSALRDNGQVALQYVDDDGRPTQQYPMNPNGSPEGIAGVTSVDGRHLAMMPHPERCVLQWQCAQHIANNKTGNTDEHNQTSPWQKLFNNAHEWASQHQ